MEVFTAKSTLQSWEALRARSAQRRVPTSKKCGAPTIEGSSEMDVLMPQPGETVAEGKITKWFVAPGDAVKPGDNLFEIETDKVSMEVPSIAAGTSRKFAWPRARSPRSVRWSR
jgi:biotin carboxyl carrier protein